MWKDKKYDELERSCIRVIKNGNWYPATFLRLAQTYRKQKRYTDEAKILQKAIQQQHRHNNPGVAARDFQKRLERAKELRDLANQRKP